MKSVLFDFWGALWAGSKSRMGLVDPDREEFSALFDSFEAVEGEYR